MKKSLKYIGFSVIIVFLVILSLYLYGNIGISKMNIEKDARKSQYIDDNWQVSKDTTNTISAMIFYDGDFINHTISIYVKRHGLSSGYFFRAGGNIGSDIDQGVGEIIIEGYEERIFMSMNRLQISKMEIDNGNDISSIDIDNTKPFVVILPASSGAITIYDTNGNSVKSTQYNL